VIITDRKTDIECLGATLTGLWRQLDRRAEMRLWNIPFCACCTSGPRAGSSPPSAMPRPPTDVGLA
jgi:hypothetical protein